MNPQAMLKLLLGASEGDVMYAIYSDYANKLNSPDTWKEFGINEDGYVPKSYENIAEYVGIQASAVKRAIGRLVKRGLLQKKPGDADTYNIPLYRPEFKSSVFIKIAEEKLKNLTTDRLDRLLNKKCIPQIIETLENDSHVLVALELVDRTKLEEFLGESNSAKKVTGTEEIQETKSSQEPKLPEEEALNALVTYFKCYYRNKYNKDYNSNDNELKRLQKIINNYSGEQWGKMISIFIERYNERWKSSKYPEPTIFGLTQDHIIKQVYDIYEQGVRYEEEERQRQSQLKKCNSWNDWNDL